MKMDSSLRSLLDSCDDEVGVEFPVDSGHDDWSSLRASVLAVQSALVSKLDIPFQLDGNVQDASFHDELRILHPSAIGPTSTVISLTEVAVRFSNFGRLYVLFSGAHGAVPERYPTARIRTIIGRFGWREVPAEPLRVPYDGRNLKLRDARITWWARFFDYL